MKYYLIKRLLRIYLALKFVYINIETVKVILTKISIDQYKISNKIQKRLMNKIVRNKNIIVLSYANELMLGENIPNSKVTRITKRESFTRNEGIFSC